MSELMDEVVDFVLTKCTGDPRRRGRLDVRIAIMNALGRQQNLVVEDEALDMVLLLGRHVSASEAANPAGYEPHYLYTRYRDQTRRSLSTDEVEMEIQLACGDGIPITALQATDIGTTLVVHWHGEIFIAYQRIFETNRWTKRTFPHHSARTIGVSDFLAGWRAAGREAPANFGGQFSTTPHPLLAIQ